MARSADINPLKFDNFSVGPDLIVMKYDDTKKEKDAVRLLEKKSFLPTKTVGNYVTGQVFSSG